MQYVDARREVYLKPLERLPGFDKIPPIIALFLNLPHLQSFPTLLPPCVWASVVWPTLWCLALADTCGCTALAVGAATLEMRVTMGQSPQTTHRDWGWEQPVDVLFCFAMAAARP